MPTFLCACPSNVRLCVCAYVPEYVHYVHVEAVFVLLAIDF